MIGGDFEFYEELINAKSIAQDFPKLLGKANFILTDTGRSAL